MFGHYVGPVLSSENANQRPLESIFLAGDLRSKRPLCSGKQTPSDLSFGRLAIRKEVLLDLPAGLL